MENIPKSAAWKGVGFWKNKITEWIEAENLENIPFYNDVFVEARAPHTESGYGKPLITDAVLDGKHCDVYHSDHNGGTLHRVFIHHKEDAADQGTN